MNLFDEIFKKKWDSSRSSSSSRSLQIIEIPLNAQPRPKKTADRALMKGTSSSTPKTRLRPETLTEPDVVLRRRNLEQVSQNVTTRKTARPISYQHTPNKALPSEKPSNFGLKETKSIPSLLEGTTRESTKIRGKAGKEHHHHNHHHSTQSSAAPLESAGSTLSSGVSAGGAPTPLPRTSSASANLNVLAAAVQSTAPRAAAQTSKSARGKGGGSRERLVDGTAAGDGGSTAASRKQQHTVAANRGESGEYLVEQMQRQLQEMATEKSALMLQLQERMDQVSDLQSEIKVLKIYQEQSVHQLEQKTEENVYLRSKLRDVVHSPLSDSEKQQLLLIDSHRHHSSAPASIALNVPNEMGDATACPTPDWDKHSSSNVSDVSVACLQDKINQMQETHYSTNEELQATLQELTDLQRQLTELQLHNNRLGDEKNLMFDSLCRQTDRLKDTRSELDHLKQLLNTTQDNSTADNSVQQYADREAQLLDIVQRLEVERDNLRDRQQELMQDVQQLRNSNDQGEEERSRLIERVRMLEGSMDAKVAENRQTEQELSQVRDDCSGGKIEIDRLKDILESARTKIVELEQDRDLSDKSELGELLDTARKEKDTLELEITHLREQVARSRNEIEKLREQVSILQEECKVTRNNAKCTQSELDYKVETLLSDKTNLIEQLQRLQETVGDFEAQNQCLNEDKRQLNGVLSETQRNLSEAEEKLVLLVAELNELKKLRDTENEEWEKFQNDLLTSVRVANDFKTEAQQDLQKIVLENKGYREKIRQLEIQLEKLKGGASEMPFARSSIRRSIHVTPRKIDEIQNVAFKDSEEIPPLKKPSKLKDHKNSKLIALESKVTAKIQDGDGDAILTKPPPKSAKPIIDISDSTVYTGILAKPLAKPVKTKQVKTRYKAAKSLEKLLTEGDEEKFKILGEMLAHIDQSVPVHLLCEEDRSLLKLKSFYDSRETYRHKPIARKPKDELCISNPLLNSVFANPALKKIAEDPNLPTVEPISPSFALKESFSFARQSKRYHLESATMLEDGLPERRRNKTTYSTFKPVSAMKKAQSASNLCEKTYLSDSDDEKSMKRYLTEEDLSRTFVIAPSDSKLSLNLWTGTYTFAKQPKRRTGSASSSDSDLHVYTVNEDINRSSSFVYESPLESLKRRRSEETRDESTGRFRKFVGGLFGSNEVIHEARNTLFAEEPEVVVIEADVHHSLNSLQRCEDDKSSMGSNFEVQERNMYLEFEDDACFKTSQDTIRNSLRGQHVLERPKDGQTNLDKIGSNLQLEFEDDAFFKDSKSSAKVSKYKETNYLRGQQVLSTEEEPEVAQKVVEATKISLERPKDGQKNLTKYLEAQSLKHEVQEPNLQLQFEDEAYLKVSKDAVCKAPTGEATELVQKVVEGTKIILERPSDDQEDSAGHSSIVSKIEVQEPNLDLEFEEEASLKASKDVSKSTDFTVGRPKYGQNLPSYLDSQSFIVSKIAVKEPNFDFEFEDEAYLNASKDVIRKGMDSIRRKRALAESLCRSDFTEEEIKLVQKVVESTEDSQSRPQSDINNDDIIVIEWIDYCNQCREVGTIALSLEEYSREIKSGRSISELDQVTRRSTEFNERASWDETKKRASIKLDTLERKYSLKDDLEQLPEKEFHYVEDLLSSWKSKTRRKMRSSIESAGFELHGPIIQEASPRFQTDTVKSRTVKMSDKDEDDSVSISSNNLTKATTFFTLPTLDLPPPKPDDDKSKDKDVRKTTNPLDYPTLERAAVSHVFNNNLPSFGKLNDCIREEHNQAAKTKFQIGSLMRKESLDGPENRESFVRARNRFLVADEESSKANKRSDSPRSSLIHKEPKSTGE